jgi:hypothetical protein
MSATFWHAPGKGATLGDLRKKAGRPLDGRTDHLVTSLGLSETDWDKTEGSRDNLRLDEVEKRVAQDGADNG